MWTELHVIVLLAELFAARTLFESRTRHRFFAVFLNLSRQVPVTSASFQILSTSLLTALLSLNPM
jgi:hypothetical protein